MEEKIQPIRLLLLDVDGVLTDGRIIINDAGEETKAFDVRDGHGLKLLQRSGVQLGVLTGRSSKVVAHRSQELGFDWVIQGAKNKLEPFQDLLRRTGLQPEEVAYVGDDLVDLPILSRVGFSATVADAAPELSAEVDYVTHACGGRGAVREICELLLKTQGHWEKLTARYWS